MNKKKLRSIACSAALSATAFLMAAPAAQAQSPQPGWFTLLDTTVFNPEQFFIVTPVDINNDNYPDLVALYQPPGKSIYDIDRPFKVFLNVADPSSTNPIGRKFIDVTSESGVNSLTKDTSSGYNANVYTLVDVNNDGNVDLITASFYYMIETYPYPNNTCHVFLGDGTGKFTYEPNSGVETIGLVNARSISALDYNRDGNIDIYISTAFKKYSHGVNDVFDHGYLFKGNGDGTFTDVTTNSGLADKLEPMYSASVFDYNNDCNPDIFTAPYCRTGGSVWQNDGNGHFKDVAKEVGYDLFKIGNGQHACTFTTTPEDVNNDGNIDLFVSEVHGGNLSGEFRTTIAMNKGPENDYSFDINPEVLPKTLSYHRGDYDGGFLDFENDGLIDLVLAEGGYAPNPNRSYFYRQRSDHSWEDATTALGLVIPELNNSGLIEPLDIDLDGDDDILMIHDNISPVLLQNNIGSKSNWIGVKLNPVVSGVNKNAVGARIYVYYGGTMHMREITVGRGMHSGQQPLILNFGLGKTDKVDSIIVRWPDKQCSRSKVDNPGINQIVTIENTPTGISGHTAQVATKIFPNPTRGYLVLQREGITTQTVAFSVTDITGRSLPVTYARSDSDKLIVNLSSLSDGIYIVTATLKNGQVISEKVVKN